MSYQLYWWLAIPALLLNSYLAGYEHKRRNLAQRCHDGATRAFVIAVMCALVIGLSAGWPGGLVFTACVAMFRLAKRLHRCSNEVARQNKALRTKNKELSEQQASLKEQLATTTKCLNDLIEATVADWRPPSNKLADKPTDM